ncbi:MAG: class I SAM-dependent methyltransferase [Hyphomicrobiales bacterium]|nr:class I SAM-dependent methyltransferase [Hyphomicrobiales bacterium]
MKIVERVCPLCASASGHKLSKYSKDGWNIHQCSECGFIFLKNVPTYDAFVNDLAWEKSYAIEKERREQTAFLRKVDKLTRWRLSWFHRHTPDLARKIFGHGKVLDIGCAGGGNLPEPLIPYGIEISSVLWARANSEMRKRGGYAIRAPAVEGIATFEDQFFHGVFARSFLEHEINPVKIVKEAYRVLEPGGIMYIRVPNFGSINRRIMGVAWCGFRYPDHVNYFTLETLKKMAAIAGFQLELLNKISFYFDDNIKAKLVKPA